MDLPDNAAPPYEAPNVEEPQGNAPTVVLGMTGEQLQLLLNGIIGNLPAGHQPAQTPHSHRICVNPPDPFTGDRTAYRTWKSQMEQYLAAQPTASENEKIVVLLSFVRGPNIDEWVNAYSEQHFHAGVWHKTLEQVWVDLDAAYTDRVGEHTALQRMRELRQKAGHAAEFFQEFEKLMWMAGLHENDRMALEYMKDALYERARYAIFNQTNMPQTFAEWKAAVLRLDDNFIRENTLLQANRRAHAPEHDPSRPAPRERAQCEPRGTATGAGTHDRRRRRGRATGRHRCSLRRPGAADGTRPEPNVAVLEMRGKTRPARAGVPKPMAPSAAVQPPSARPREPGAGGPPAVPRPERG
ncbi:hypothetical protein C8Q77DRAFT_1073534 [Trametes polyzona]|nr:hypothetical protein C8Q77DRAFT_1073534 [Trametes polyzona]